MKRFEWICGLLLTAVIPTSAQPAFQNLDFESANIPPLGGRVPFADVFPGWTGYIRTTQAAYVDVNAIPLGEGISIVGPNSFFPTLEGDYSAILQVVYPATATFAQTGLIPATAQSLQMKVWASTRDELGVTIGGQNIAMVPLQVTTAYTVYGGDIAAFAGEVEELRIGFGPIPTYSFGFMELDSMEFSSMAIPEPRNLHLVTGAFFLAILFAKRWRLKGQHKSF